MQGGCFGGFSELLDPSPVDLAALKDGDHLAAVAAGLVPFNLAHAAAKPRAWERCWGLGRP